MSVYASMFEHSYVGIYFHTYTYVYVGLYVYKLYRMMFSFMHARINRY